MLSLALLLALLALLADVAQSKTLYETLGLRNSAREDEIKAAYRSLAKTYHPDKNKQDPDAQSKFVEISNAYEVLSDDSKRREYDQQLRYGGEASINRRRHHSHAPSDFNSPFDDIFNDIYNQQQDETVYVYSSRGGRTYYRFHSSNNGFHRQFHQSYQVHPTTGWLGIIMQLLLMSPLFSFLFVIMVFTTCCCSSGASSSKSINNLPNISREALTVHPNHISIIIDSHFEELITARIKRHFVHDRLYFYKSSTSIEPYILLAVTKAGTKWCAITESTFMSSAHDPEYTIINWITRVINGEVKYNSDHDFITDRVN